MNIFLGVSKCWNYPYENIVIMIIIGWKESNNGLSELTNITIGFCSAHPLW